ncbi:hypothetical protein HQ520_03120 [bacterium]|nr:hypothetical protein [bacterium]
MRDIPWVGFADSRPGLPIRIAGVGDGLTTVAKGALLIEVDVPGFSLERVQSPDGRFFQRLVIPGASEGALGVGSPELPWRGFYVRVPARARLRAEILEKDAAVYDLDLPLWPTQPARPETGAPAPFILEPAAYERPGPALGAALGITHAVMGDSRLAFVKILPVLYEAVEGRVTVFHRLTIRLSLEPDADASANAGGPRQLRHISSPTADRLALFSLAETAEIAAYSPVQPQTYPAEETGADYLIIAADSLVPAIQPLADWKRLKGYRTRVMKISDVGASPVQIQEYLSAASAGWRPAPRYVLLVGDADTVPPTSFLSPFPVVSDYPYACVRGNDLLPDLAIGRLPVRTPAECSNVVAKILAYDRDPDGGGWYASFLAAAIFQDDGRDDPFLAHDGEADRWFMETAMTAWDFLVNEKQWQGYSALCASEWPLSPTTWRFNSEAFPHRDAVNLARWGSASVEPMPSWIVDRWTSPEQATLDILNSLNAGCGLVLHRGHGSSVSWWDPFFGAGQIIELRNAARTPVVLSMDCLTGSFDSVADSFAETFLKQSPGGAVGVVAATRASYSGYNDLLLHGIFTALWPDYDLSHANTIPVARPAEALNFAKGYLFEYYGENDVSEHEARLFHWLGDPEMALRTRAPLDLDVEHPSSLTAGTATTVTVRVRVGGESLSDALVSLTQDNLPDGIWSGVTDTNGSVSLGPVLIDEPGACRLIVTARDAVPYESALPAEVGPAGFLKLDQTVYPSPGTLRLILGDSNLAGSGIVLLPVASDAGDTETLSLVESPEVQGLFAGRLSLSPVSSGVEDGVLTAGNGDRIAAAYHDLDRGNGTAALMEVAAVADARAPVILKPAVSSITRNGAHFSWITDEPTTALLILSATDGSSTQTLRRTPFSSAHALTVSGLRTATAYHSLIVASDRVGNLTAIAGHSFTTLARRTPPFFEGFESGLANWAVNSDASGDLPLVETRSVLSGGQTPLSGSGVAFLGDATEDQYAYSTLDLVLDLAEVPRARLEFAWTTYGMEADNFVRLDVWDGEWHTDVNAWAYDQVGWQRQTLNLSQFDLIDGFIVRFFACTNWTEDGDAIYIDDVSVTVPDSLDLLWPENAIFAGEPGGPWNPLEALATLVNLSDNLPLDWVMDEKPDWLELSQSQGVLDPDERLPLVVRPAGSATSLTSGDHAGTVTILNRSIGVRHHRQFLLHVSPPAPADAFLWFPMNSDPGWTSEGKWQFGRPLSMGTGDGDPDSGFSGPYVYGYNLSGDYENLMPPRALTTPAMNCAGWRSVRLRFQRWLAVEDSQYDKARVQASADGQNWSDVWAHAGGNISDSAWTPCEYDLSLADDQPAVYLRWVMGETDNVLTFPGWNIDDVALLGERIPRPENWGDELTAVNGWRPERHPRFLADVTGDGRADLVGFGDRGVAVAPSTGSAFAPLTRWTEGFGYEAGWLVDRHPRFLADVNGDARCDLIGFGDSGVTVALSTGSAFPAPSIWTPGFGYRAGWQTDRHPRFLADANGDGRMDVLGFGDHGVTVALSTGSAFESAAIWANGFGYEAGWRTDRHQRLCADLNGDGRADLAGFGDHGVAVSLAEDGRFAPAQLWVKGFGSADGWGIESHPRFLADVNDDSRDDLIGFGDRGVTVALSTGEAFAAPFLWLAAFNPADGWDSTRHLRLAHDLDGDARSDLVGFKDSAVWTALSTGTGFLPIQEWIPAFGYLQGWRKENHLRVVTEVDGDGLADIVGIGEKAVWAY